jgi:hypothetical protein
MGRQAKNLPTVRFRTRFEKQRRGHSGCAVEFQLSQLLELLSGSPSRHPRALRPLHTYKCILCMCSRERGGRRFRPSASDNANSFSPLFSWRNWHAGKCSRFCGKFLCTHLEREVLINERQQPDAFNKGEIM